MDGKTLSILPPSWWRIETPEEADEGAYRVGLWVDLTEGANSDTR
jgi:hypothetical protein